MVSVPASQQGTAPNHLTVLRTLAATVDSDAQGYGLDPTLLELVRIRASQINGCSFCVELHTREARAKGETEQRLRAMVAWREQPLFTERERVALALTEAATLIHDSATLDDVYRAAADQFDHPQLAELLWVIAIINAYNRLAISNRIHQPATTRS